MRRKWTNVNKDPVKGMKDDFMNKNSYWGTLNHLPAKGVGKIVTDKILDMDRQTCDRILQNILQDKVMDMCLYRELGVHKAGDSGESCEGEAPCHRPICSFGKWADYPRAACEG